MRFGAVGDKGGGEAEVWGVKGKDSLDVGEHEIVRMSIVNGVIVYLGGGRSRSRGEGGMGSG